MPNGVCLHITKFLIGRIFITRQLISDIKQRTFIMVIYNFDVGQVINEKPLTLFERQSMHLNNLFELESIVF